MINPSIFIGLGSSGTDVLEYLQMLLLEEYGIPCLPIFKYLGIETNQSHIPETSYGIKSEIEMVYPIITSTLSIKDEIRSGKKEYLMEWLDEAILDIPGNSFTLGASNIRQAGRLCLFENWGLVTSALNNAKAKVTNHINIRNTIHILRDYYKKVGKKVALSEEVIGSTPNIYIVGSLCGGTASGMLIDIAYYLRYLFGLWAINYKNKLSTNIQGIFTILDEKLLSRVGMPDIDKWAANCYSSLIELDFMSHPSSTYEVLLPDGIKIKSNDTPYDYLYILSCSGLGGTFWKEDGSSPDLPALNHMIAMILFTEVVSDLYSRKEEIRTDFRGFANAGIPNENEHVPCFASCGISAIWYPKYRITRAVAAQMASELFKKWQGETGLLDHTVINQDASKALKTLLDSHITILTRKPGGSIESEIKEKFDKQIPNISRDELPKIIENIGISDILSKLKEEGSYSEIIKNQLAIFKKTMLDEIRDIITQRINKTQNLSDVRAFLISLDREIEKIIFSLPSRYPMISTLIVDEILQKAKPGIFDVTRKRREWKKRKALDELYNYVIFLLKQIRGFKVKPVLVEIRQILGCSVSNPEISSIRNEIDNMIEKLQVSIDRLVEEVEKQTALPVMQSIEIIANNPENSILEEVDILKGRLSTLPSHKWRMLINKIFAIDEERKMELRDFLLLSPEEIILKATNPFQAEALDSIKKFNIACDIQKKMDRAILLMIAKRSLPYISLSGELIELQRPPSFICGDDEEGGLNMKSLDSFLRDPSFQNKISFGKTIISKELDHLLIFYNEQGLLYLDKNLTTERLFYHKYREALINSPYEIHIQKGGRVHFDVIMEKHKKEVKALLKIAKDLFKNEIFERTRDGFIFRYIDSVGIHTLWSPDKHPIEAITSDEQGFLQFKEKVTSAIKGAGHSGLLERINEYISGIEKNKGEDEASLEAGYYKNILLEYFPECV